MNQLQNRILKRFYKGSLIYNKLRPDYIFKIRKTIQKKTSEIILHQIPPIHSTTKIQIKKNYKMSQTICNPKTLLFLSTFLLFSLTLGSIDKTKHHTYEEMLEIMEETKRKCPEIIHLYNLTGPSNTTKNGHHLPVIVIAASPERHKIGM